jgi:adenine-specific DNA-methyltransferase
LLSNKNAIVLDFFAGSGTTGEAVISLNEDDNGSRQFILVTNNDEVVNGTKHKIMSDVCYPRIKKASKMSKNGVKFYKTAFIGKNNILNATDQDKIELAHNAGELLAIAENTLDLVKQNKFYQLFEDSDKKKYTAVYFREELDKFNEFSEMVRKFKKPTTIYVFSWGDEEFFDDFADLKQVKVKTIPVPILEIYKQIYNLSIE